MSLFTAGDQMDEYERRDAHPPQPDAPGWRDIATAPINGTHVLLCEDGVVFEGRMVEDGGWFARNNCPTDHWGGECFPTAWMPLPPPPSADSLGGDEAKRTEPDALPGDLRERVARRAAAAILEQDGYSAVGPYLNADLTLDYLDQGEVDFGKVADAILSLIQSERGEP